jgi:hypothetical protein
MRRLVVLVIVLGVLAGLLSIADIFVRHQVQDGIASRIEHRQPGVHAKVAISSFPFVWRLGTSGTIPHIRVDLTGVTAGSLAFSRVELNLSDLQIRRSSLLHGHVDLQGLGRGVVTADISQQAVDQRVGLPITLSPGTVGMGGLQLPAQISIDGTAVTVRFGSSHAITLKVPSLNLLPCIGAADLVAGALQLSCTVTGLPSAQVQHSYGL